MDSARSALRSVSPVDPVSRDRRDVRSVGRRARLELVFGYRRGRTVLSHVYAEPPFRIGRSFEMGRAAYVIIVCSGPGVFAGDCLQQSVRVGPGASVLLGSQSALQVHPGTDSSGARLHQRYAVAEEGELHCHWDPLIPFAGARLAHRVELDLASSSRLSWSDALMSGRSARGEDWMFAELVHELRLRIDGSLKYLERYRLAPEERAVTSGPIAGEARYLGTALIHDAAATASAAEALQHQLDQVEGARAGVDLVDLKVIVARLISRRGVPFRAARAAFRAHAASEFRFPVASAFRRTWAG